MVFLPGEHTLDRTILVSNVTRLTMCGESSSDNIATVVRNGSVGFSFTNMEDLTIYSLAFTSYNRSWNYGSHLASSSALFLQSTQNAQLVNCSFHVNIGTALAVKNTSVTQVENKFIHNQCACVSFSEMLELGCGITTFNSNLTFIGNTSFLENTRTATIYPFHCAGAIWASGSSLHFTGTNNFINNGIKGLAGGAIYAENNSSMSFSGTSNFAHNSAKFGGAIAASDNVMVTFHGTNNFVSNSANNKFIGISLSSYYSLGGAICAGQNVALTFNGTNNFINNSVDSLGGAIFARMNTALTFIGNSSFSNNSAQDNGGAIAAETNISLSFTGTSNFNSNSAMQGGAIFAIRNSTLTFNGANTFTNNGHTNKFNINNGVSCGGAMYLAISSLFSVLPHTTVHWENNHANLGGAICVSDANPSIYCTDSEQFILKEKCFFQIPRPGQILSGGQLVLKNNSADFAGSVLYGGAIDKCELIGVKIYSSGELFDKLIINNDPDENTTSNISSDPIKICPCKNNLPDCRRSVQYPHMVYPGETFQFPVVAVGQRDGTVSSTVRSTVTTTKSHLLDYQYLQHTNNTCTKLNYTVFSLSQHVDINLYPEGSPCSRLNRYTQVISVNLHQTCPPGFDISCSRYDDGPLYFSLTINQTCPPGFDFSMSARSCVCESRLAQYTNQCNITNGVGRITRESGQQFWVGYDHSSLELILHPQCPLDYCVNDTVVFHLDLTNTDVQCAYNRRGFLCGRCKEGYSLVLGIHQCRKCTNSHLALLVLFAVMGVALVFLLLVCKLTVATGTLSGLVFYANIVGPNRTIFLPAGSTDALSVFIAWLNLDFGIETCFYNGMDAYSKTWLQFVFPVYIWLLVGLVILVSHYSQSFTNLLGSNPVSVLATLILLSYTKVLHTLISASSFTNLDYPNNSTRRVWLRDANIDYLLGKHTPLFLMTLFFLLFLFLPYTLLLLFGQWLQAISHLRLFSWVNNARLKPFMDSYHAPYKGKHRYWPGLLLVLRFVLTLVFAFHVPSFSLLAIVVGAGILQLWAWVSGGVYKNWCLDALEASFVLNLTILSAATYYVDQMYGNKFAVWYTSVTIALVTFIAILAYHVFQQLRQTNLWKKVPKPKLGFKKLNTKQAEYNLNNPINNPMAEDFDQLREPWLEDLLPPTHSVV